MPSWVFNSQYSTPWLSKLAVLLQTFLSQSNFFLNQRDLHAIYHLVHQQASLLQWFLPYSVVTSPGCTVISISPTSLPVSLSDAMWCASLRWQWVETTADGWLVLKLAIDPENDPDREGLACTAAEQVEKLKFRTHKYGDDLPNFLMQPLMAFSRVSAEMYPHSHHPKHHLWELGCQWWTCSASGTPQDWSQWSNMPVFLQLYKYTRHISNQWCCLFLSCWHSLAYAVFCTHCRLLSNNDVSMDGWMNDWIFSEDHPIQISSSSARQVSVFEWLRVENFDQNKHQG